MCTDLFLYIYSHTGAHRGCVSSRAITSPYPHNGEHAAALDREVEKLWKIVLRRISSGSKEAAQAYQALNVRCCGPKPPVRPAMSVVEPCRPVQQAAAPP